MFYKLGNVNLFSKYVICYYVTIILSILVNVSIRGSLFQILPCILYLGWNLVLRHYTTRFEAVVALSSAKQGMRACRKHGSPLICLYK